MALPAHAETFITAVTAIGQSTSQVEPVIPGEVEVHEIFAFDKQVLDNLAHQTYSGYFYMDTFRPPACILDSSVQTQEISSPQISVSVDLSHMFDPLLKLRQTFLHSE